MAAKMLCTVFAVTLLVAGIQANVEQPQSTSPIKNVPLTSVFPSSLLFLLSRRPIGLQPSRPAKPEAPAPPSLPASPLAPSSPAAPALPNIPFQQSHSYPDAPSVPNVPNAPVAPSFPGGQVRPRYPLFQRLATPKYFSSPVNAEPSTPTLSYDNGNRKLLNTVHIPLRGTPPQVQTVPLGATPLNYEYQDNIATSPQQPLPSNSNIVPLGALPLNSEANSGKTNTVNSEDLTPVPIYTNGASPIPAKPNNSDKPGPSDSTALNTFNPKYIPYQPIGNIEASPIPIRSPNYSEESKNTRGEDLTADPSDSVGTSIPSKPDENGGKNTSDVKNTITINTKDFASEPSDTVAASPIPVKPKKKVPLILEAPESSGSAVYTNDESEENSSASANNEPSNDQNKTEEPQNPLKDVILNGTSQGSPNEGSSGEPENPLKDTLLNGTSSTDVSNPEENPLKDQIFNGSSPSENEENESESFESETKNSETDNGSNKVSQSESRKENQVSSQNGDIKSSDAEEQETEETQTVYSE